MIDRSLPTGSRRSGGCKSFLLMGTALAGALVVPLMGEVRPAQAACNVGGVGGGTVSCDTTATTDSTFTLPPFSPVAVNER
jgi:hypothetical protein